jgi:signal transduction histidine kinase
MARLPPMQRPGRTALLSYSVAALSVAVAVAAGLLLKHYAQSSPFASLFLCAVVFSSWSAGRGPGLLATALSLLAFSYYFVPIWSLDTAPAEAPRLILLAVTALFVVWLSAGRRGVEGALRRSEAYLAEAQRLSHTGSFGWKIASGKMVWSKETYQIFGIDQATEPTIALLLERVHPDDRALVQREVDRAAAGEENYDYEHRLLLPDGTVKHLHVVAHRVTYGSESAEIVGALMDVTATRGAQDALHAAQAELAHVARITTFGQLNAAIAHEVNQPLAAIVANAQATLRWLNRDVPNIAEAVAAVRRIVDDGNRAGGVTRRVRDLAKKVSPEVVELGVDEVVEEAVALVRREALSRRVAVRLEIDAGLPLIRGDRIQLQQVIINLAINGIQAMSEVADRPRILTIRSEQEDPGHVAIAIEDVGVGIDAGSVRRLFSAFYTTKPDGMGMGLAICRSIVEAHGGRVSASRNVGPGMTFKFTIPLDRSASAAS